MKLKNNNSNFQKKIGKSLSINLKFFSRLFTFLIQISNQSFQSIKIKLKIKQFLQIVKQTQNLTKNFESTKKILNNYFRKKSAQKKCSESDRKNSSRGWFRSIDLWVMSPARFRCATLLTSCSSNLLNLFYILNVKLIIVSTIKFL